MNFNGNLKGFVYKKYFVTEEKAFYMKPLVLDPNTHVHIYICSNYANQIYRNLKFTL